MYSCANLMAQSFLQLDCVFSTGEHEPKKWTETVCFFKIGTKEQWDRVGEWYRSNPLQPLDCYRRTFQFGAKRTLCENQIPLAERDFFFQNNHMSTEIEYFLELLTNGPYSGIAPKWTSLRIRSREYYIQEFLVLKRFSIFPSKPSVSAI